MITTPVRNIRHARAIMQTRKVCVTGRGSPLLHFDWRKTVYKQTDHSKNLMLTNVLVVLEANCFRASMTVKYEFMNQTLHSNPCNKFTCSAHSLLSQVICHMIRFMARMNEKDCSKHRANLLAEEESLLWNKDFLYGLLIQLMTLEESDLITICLWCNKTICHWYKKFA